MVLGTKTGLTQQFVGRLLIHERRLFSRDHAFFNGFLLDPRCVDTAAIIGDSNNGLVTLIKGANRNRTLCRLTFARAHRGVFNAMNNGVVHQVGHRVVELFQNRLINEGVTAIHSQTNLLACFEG